MNSLVTTSEAKRRLYEDPDFINLKRFDFSLKKLLLRYPNGCPDRIIAQALMISEDDVQVTYDRVLGKLKEIFGVDGEDAIDG